MTLIKDLIKIPEVSGGDFVLKLASGVKDDNAAETLSSYVVTDQLKATFDKALSFIKGALAKNVSKATYLHGSFGSGKSHFMAVLHLILQHNTTARGIPELASVIQKHNDWSKGKKFLLVPYHMIGSDNMESGILGQYVRFIREHDPTAPVPGVYRTEGLFEDAVSLRETMGDDAFFGKLNSGAAEASEAAGRGFGDLDATWDAARFDAAVNAPPGNDERSLLVSALIQHFFKQYHTVKGADGEAYVDLDEGLSIISRHAAELGYDGLILFLDELILWLASRAGDMKFLLEEGPKLSKLVEAANMDRPCPIISFVAKQRDLKELLADDVPGADQLNFGAQLEYWSGRFETITLEDRNLPLIAKRRVLACHDDAAERELQASFEKLSLNEKARDTLLTSKGDLEMFKLVYPFSPALVQTLIDVSGVLQRERTALKVMAELLWEQRETLEVGDIVPVGDLYDMIAHGDEAFNRDMALHFDRAKTLYHRKLLPMLERSHGVKRQDLQALPHNDLTRKNFENDDRLMKTLLLGALCPGVESLRGLTKDRLAALNHGTFKTRVKGNEGALILQRCSDWATEVGEVRIGPEENPTISIKLSGVDTERIIAKATGEDNRGTRITRLRHMLFEQFDITSEANLYEAHRYTWNWKNTERSCEVAFGNIRDTSLNDLKASGQDWKLCISLPFDEPGYGPKDDLSKKDAFLAEHPEGSRTLFWVPSYFSKSAERDLKLLVILEHVLSGERFNQYADHLSPMERPEAKAALESQLNQLRQRMLKHLYTAYGLDAGDHNSIDGSLELEASEKVTSLLPGFDPSPPTGANLRTFMDNLLAQALEKQFPGHPRFGEEVSSRNVKWVYETVSECIRDGGRVLVEQKKRKVISGIANPLQLGLLEDDKDHFVLGHHWEQHFSRRHNQQGGELTVEKLRQWINEPAEMGLPTELENLVILAYAEQTNRSFYRHGGIQEATLKKIDDRFELRTEKLPSEDNWKQAYAVASVIFGTAGLSPLLNAANAARLSAEVKTVAGNSATDCSQYCRQLRDRLGANGTNAARLKTAEATLALIEAVRNAENSEVVDVLATAQLVTSIDAMGRSRGQAKDLESRLDQTDWGIFDGIRELSPPHDVQAKQIAGEVDEALNSDEYNIELAPVLKAAQASAVNLLRRALKAPVKPQTDTPDNGDPDISLPGPTTVKVPPGRKVVRAGRKAAASPKQLRDVVKDLEKQLNDNETIEIDVDWRIIGEETES